MKSMKLIYEGFDAFVSLHVYNSDERLFNVPVIKSDGHTYKVIEGRFEQFVKDLHWEKSETTGYTHVTTTISKWDTTLSLIHI